MADDVGSFLGPSPVAKAVGELLEGLREVRARQSIEVKRLASAPQRAEPVAASLTETARFP